MKNTSAMDLQDELYLETTRVYGYHQPQKKHPWKSKLGWGLACAVVILYLTYEFLHCANAF